MKQEIYYEFPTITDEQKNILNGLQTKEQIDKIPTLEALVNSSCQFQGLRMAIDELKDYGQQFLNVALPIMSESALILLNQPPKKKMLINNQIEEFTRNEIYSIMSLAFFGLLKKIKNLECPSPSNLTYLLVNEQTKEKIKCYIHYFLQAKRNDEKVIYERIGFQQDYHIKYFFKNQPKLSGELWEYSDIKLQPIIFTKEVIEKHENCTIVDFANKYIGGGVLSFGQVQEEILFTIMPETIIAVIFSTVLGDEETFIIRNAIRYSNYVGYGKTFNFKFCQPQNLKQDILALDALNFSYQFKKQFTKKCILREINKAFIGFSLSPQTQDLDYERDIVTGKWGCGAFYGDVELKIIIQLIAFSASRYRGLKNQKGSLIFSTFNDDKYQYYQNRVNAIINKYQTIGKLCKQIFNQEQKNENLFKNLE